MTQIEIRQKLEALADPAYREFYAGLIPGVIGVLGVRMPALRKVAREIARGDFRAYMDAAQDGSYEEVLLQGLVIGYAKAEPDELLAYTERFVEKIDNWAVCDSFCIGFKLAKAHQETVWAFLQPYLASQKPYSIRFGVVMLLNYYIDQPHLSQVLGLLDGIRHDDYYVRMAVAWAVSACFTAFPEETMRYLQQSQLDDWTYNKALQKIVESRLVDDATRTEIRAMKRKEVRQNA